MQRLPQLRLFRSFVFEIIKRLSRSDNGRVGRGTRPERVESRDVVSWNRTESKHVGLAGGHHNAADDQYFSHRGGFGRAVGISAQSDMDHRSRRVAFEREFRG
jgi:hypothetical protein